MPEIISNSSCLIALDNIGMLHILREVYTKIHITQEVAHELGKPLDDWIEIRQVQDRKYLRMLHTLVDLGEASTIALSFELSENVLILDDLKARKLARSLELTFTGLLGVLLKARQQNVIPSVSAIIKKLKAVNFRISDIQFVTYLCKLV